MTREAVLFRRGKAWERNEMASDIDREVVLELSDALVEAQKPILILNSVKWTDEVREQFYADGAEKQPQVDTEYYTSERGLAFDVDDKRAEFTSLAARVDKELGKSAIGQLLTGRIEGYTSVIDMLAARGTPAFAEISAGLYGSVADRLHDDGPTHIELGEVLDDALDNISDGRWEPPEDLCYTAAEGVEILTERLTAVAGLEDVNVRIDDGIVADAAAGSDYIKLREDAQFSERALRVLEVHEGWVHVATSVNGRRQPWCTFLAKGTPATTVTQEGTAVFTEITTLSSTPTRLGAISRRIQAIGMAEDGATFLDVYRWMLEQGLDTDNAWTSTVRVYRGSTPTLGPFTKDLAYGRGFIEVYNLVRLATKLGRLELIPLLFVGKISVHELGLIAQLHHDGLIVDPETLPPSISDVTALASWMAMSNLLNRVDVDEMEVVLSRALEEPDR